MILRELFYADKDLQGVANNLQYSPSHDSTAMKRKDTRKTRLTLRQINELRKASEAHILEQEKDLELVSAMYMVPAAPAA
jgi:hypothetical protein